MKRVFLLATALITGLTGCSSAPEATGALYLLPKSETKTSNQMSVTERPLLVIRPAQLASYLNDNSIVYRTSDTQIFQAKRHQWAQSISEQITQRVVAELRQKQSDYWPVEMNNLLDQSGESKLQLTLNKFNGSYQGNAEIEGEWLLIDASGNVVRSSQVKILMPLQDEGYDALVDALSAGLNQLTDDMAAQL
ncbi:membrane integrity-associated transporter subunit PqiC [Vibrio parahaemolyticus]|nr:membrane integrity-associated transporter subunit PqiC [Vibrio parahaemolyticus]EJG0750769.1 membrane integrity-associated transporter subunit PqiC [Vibrio parahaemolyticus]ELA9876726.1 membrane integrity-associated transporter subunit PqiC [Vibrio parahaemolyticus]